MIKTRLVLPQIQNLGATIGTVALTLEQQNYLYKVLRLKIGAEFIALDGQGGWWRASLTPDLGQVKILEQIPSISSPKLT